MACLVRFPKVGANVAEGTIGVWHKAMDETVGKGDPLVEIITSKATFDVESPADGLVRAILAPEKSSLPVGYILGIVADPGEDLPDVTAENARLVLEFQAQAEKEAAGGASAETSAKKIKATPGARRLAKELGIDLARVAAESAGPVVREDDVRRVGVRTEK